MGGQVNHRRLPAQTVADTPEQIKQWAEALNRRGREAAGTDGPGRLQATCCGSPADEQKVIVGQLDGLFVNGRRLASIYQRKLAPFDELKKSLLHQAFNGQL